MAKSNRPIRMMVAQSLSTNSRVVEMIEKGNDIQIIPDEEVDVILHPLAFRIVPGMEDFMIEHAVKAARKQKYSKKGTSE